MPSYTKINLSGDLAAVLNRNAQQPAMAKEAHSVIHRAATAAVENDKAHAKAVAALQQKAKDSLAQIERLFKVLQKEPRPALMDAVRGAQKIIETCVKAQSDADTAFAAANVDWRTGWDGDANRALAGHTGMNFDGYIKLQRKSVQDFQANLIAARRTREYQERGKGLLEQAEKLGGGNKATETQAAELDRLETAFKAKLATTRSEATKALTTLGTIGGALLKKKTFDAKDRDDVSQMAAKARLEGKNARGALKTLTAELDRMTKLCAKMSPAYRKRPDEPKRALKELEALSGKVDKLEADLAKLEKKAGK